ncbi:MAG: mycothiol synthase [Candidatus Nanopelagicales bacterium]
MSEISLFSYDHLDHGHIHEVQDLLAAATDADGVRPLSEHVWMHVIHGGDERARHILGRTSSGQLIGYAHLDATDEVDGPSAELVVHPESRRQGVGRALVTHMLAETDGRLRLWAHGEHIAATRLAASLGFEQHRTLWQMRRSLHASIPEPRFPEGIQVRSFEVGSDEMPVLALNENAFRHLPDQGSWTSDDLRRREKEAWFDPAGFLLAWTVDHELAGFHWTKVHGAHRPHGRSIATHAHDGLHEHSHEHSHEAIGEVYVLAVAPGWQGSGLGRALTLAGLNHLRRLGLDQVMLYVDAANMAAIRLYESLGFVRWDTDVMYRSGR